MSDQTSDKASSPDRQPESPLLKRRGLMAAAWAAVAGFVAAKTTRPVEATSGTGADGAVVMGSNFINDPNYANSITVVATGGSNWTTSATVLDVDAAYGGGINPNICAIYGHGKGLGCGVTGVAGGAATSSVSRNTLNAGVAGVNHGSTAGGMALYGEIPASNSVSSIAIYGLNYSTYAGPGPGAGGFGIYGLSANGHGLVGATAASGAAALVGASNGVAGAYAATLYGTTVVVGDFTVTGGAKSAAVPHPDGSHRRLYCLETPESWFEDVGSAALDCGSTDVTLDPDFAAVVRTDDYHVFVTAYGQPADLCVTQRTATGFRVEARDKDSRVTFSWRVMARRKDIPGERFAKVEIPTAPELPGVPPPGTPDRGATAGLGR